MRGIRDIHNLNIVHRDLKLANVLLHFPDMPQLEQLTPQMKKQFLRQVDLTAVNFKAKISDFGLSKVLDDTQSQQTIVGTPLYQSP